MKETGVALVICVLAMTLLMALGAALVLSTSTETLIAANFRIAHEGRYAAAAVLERAMADLSTIPDWSRVLDGSATSGFTDGPPSGSRTLADGVTVDLGEVVNLANCGRPAPCTDSQLDAITVERPWGINNPRWRLYAYGELDALLGPGNSLPRSQYLLVLAADDQAESDGNPLVDGSNPGNPGSGVIVLRGESFGAKGAHRAYEVTVSRSSSGVRILSWRNGSLP